MIKAFSKALLWKFSATGLQFLLGLVMAAFAGAAIWGDMALMIASSALFLLISSLGADVSLVWHGSQDQTEEKQLLGIAYTVIARQMLLYFTLLLFSITWFNRLPLSHFNNSDWHFEVVFILGLLLTERYTALFFSRHWEHACNFSLALINGILILSVIGASCIDFLNRAALPQYYCVAVLVQALVLITVFHIKTSSIRFQWPGKKLRKSFYKFSLFVFVTNLIQFLAYRLDFWMLENFSGNIAVGNYSQATRFVQLFWVLPQAAASLMLSSILNQKKEDAELFVWKLLKSLGPVVLLLLGPFLFVVYVLFHSLLLDFTLGWQACLILLPGSLLFMISIITSPFFTASNQLMVNLKISSGCLICIALLDLLLIPGFGIIGAALASSIGYGLSGLASLYIFRKYSTTNGKDVSGWTLFIEIFSQQKNK